MSTYPIIFRDQEGQEVRLTNAQTSIDFVRYAPNTENENSYSRKTDAKLNVLVFCKENSASEEDKKKNIVILDGYIGEKVFADEILEDVDERFIVNLQDKNNLQLNYMTTWVNYGVKLFDPVKDISRVDICRALNVARPSWSGKDENFTFAFLKDVFKALNMGGYSSKSKEQLLDEILERMTEDAQETKVTIGPRLVMSGKASRYSRRYHREEVPTEAYVSDYKQSVAIGSRILGKVVFLPDHEPTPDARTLEMEYDLVEIVDPYDGLDEFISEQKTGKTKKNPENDDANS